NLKIFTRQVENSDLKEFKGEMMVKTTMKTLAALLLDDQAATQWMHLCEKFEIVERTDELNAVIYFINGAPWPVSDRDAVIQSSMTQDPESLVVTVAINTLDDRLPKDDDYVRIARMSGFWLFEPKEAGQVLVTYQIHANPGGGLPTWLANSVVVDTPYGTMTQMVEMLKLEKYQQASVPMIKNVQ
ncbi:MAG: START domain-containing protein, partial [Oleispira antarctica]|nr:START domain-containing protein [Oleispira antarctica]MBQ0793483.1 START domain-containing protein [Oleispira antarctica]